MTPEHLHGNPPKLPTRAQLLERAIRWHERGKVDDRVLARIRAGHPVTVAEHLEMRANSWERHLLYHLYDEEALALAMDYSGMNTAACFRRGSYPLDYDTGDHYDETLALVLVPLAAARLRQVAAAHKGPSVAVAGVRTERELRSVMDTYADAVVDGRQGGD
jgi:nucleotide-binding universal stress UspA family protein